ncbi:hypothetical protein OSB04_016057 [Centaurea solstitialis]|uniref:TIR domain-containing protein n=1 Tax=Centaurea solstitialis TaxID=347529 RepID=A0AA38TID8_9ASTR|nr:hypothetical protein OSB04_016057 [Centaurea solstitialis]
MASNDSRFDVFLSFRGEDTRHAFTDHLYTALKQAGIATFRDNDEIGRGEELEPEIIKAIKDSKGSIVVLSENYAKSRWCLDELLLILEQRRMNFNHFVLPVFYHVDPSDIRDQRESFTIEVDEVVEGSKWTRYKVDRWKKALAEVANLTGMVVSGSEADFIGKIVDTIERKLDLKLVSTPAHLTGMDARAEGINSWLNGESTADVLAICGIGGIDILGARIKRYPVFLRLQFFPILIFIFIYRPLLIAVTTTATAATVPFSSPATATAAAMATGTTIAIASATSATSATTTSAEASDTTAATSASATTAAGHGQLDHCDHVRQPPRPPPPRPQPRSPRPPPPPWNI